MKYTLLLLICMCLSSAQAEGLYREKYRPQYHFTPAGRWIGDPCGTIKYNGRYMAYSWGAAVSDDLIHWKELNDHAIHGLPRNISTFTGSVVVDPLDTSGFGKNALVAAFTSFDEVSKKQSQSIAFSHDGGVTFSYYDLNPVVDIWSTEFRDPTVIWDENNKRWVMLVAKALEKKIAFYGSSDLKHWEWLSEFGPMGDSERSWECPDLFQLPVEGTGERKWVLLISINWAREQYFVGNFDGTTFIPDVPDAAPLYVDYGLDYYASRVFQDFDNPDTGDVYTVGWVNTWDYAGSAPSKWGKGIWSIPRKMSLYPTAEGLRLKQSPVETLAGQRKAPVKFTAGQSMGAVALADVENFGNVYEMNVRFDTSARDVLGLNLCAGEGRKVTISYDTTSKYLTIDRTNSTDADIPKFDRIAYCRVPDKHGLLDMTILVDKSVMEIFANDGESVFTLLTYSPDDSAGAEFFSLYGKGSAEFTVWPLETVWTDVR